MEEELLSKCIKPVFISFAFCLPIAFILKTLRPETKKSDAIILKVIRWMRPITRCIFSIKTETPVFTVWRWPTEEAKQIGHFYCSNIINKLLKYKCQEFDVIHKIAVYALIFNDFTEAIIKSINEWALILLVVFCICKQNIYYSKTKWLMIETIVWIQKIRTDFELNCICTGHTTDTLIQSISELINFFFCSEVNCFIIRCESNWRES